VGESQDSATAAEELTDKPCDVLLLSSVAMLQAVAESVNAAGRATRPKPLLFGMEESADAFFQAVRLGACGYLLK